MMAVYQGIRPIGGLRPFGPVGSPGARATADGRHTIAGRGTVRHARPAAGVRSRHQERFAGVSPLDPERLYERGADRIQRMAIPRRRQTAHTRAGRRQGRIGVALAGILVTFLLALFYLTQTVHVAATNYDIGSLLADRDRMNQQLQSLQGDIARLGAEHAVSGRAQELDLDPLGAAVWVRPR